MFGFGEDSRRKRAALLAALLVAAALATAPAGAEAQLQSSDSSRNWKDKPVGSDGRRHVKVCIDKEPVAGYEQAVRDAMAAWNAAQDFPGGVKLEEDCNDPDVKVKWDSDPDSESWGTTSPREGRTGARTVTISYTYRDNSGSTQNLNAQQVENIARHELGHAEGLKDDAAAGAGTMRRESTASGLDGGDWPVSDKEVASKKSLYEVTPTPVAITPEVGIFEFDGYFYFNYSFANGGGITPSELGFLFPFVTPRGLNHWVPSGWTPNYAQSGFGVSGPASTRGKAHPSEGVFYVQASPGNEFVPGTEVQVALASTTGPTLGSVYFLDAPMKKLGEIPSVPVPGQRYYFAEGAAVDGVFETWVLLANPSTANDAQARVSFRTGTSAFAEQVVELPPASRVSLKANNFVQSFDVSTEVEVLDGWVSAEASIYGLSPERRGAATYRPSPSPSETWYLPEGAAEGPYETWALVYNPMDIPVHTYLTFFTDTGPRPGPQLEIPPRQRRTFRVNDHIGEPTYHVSTMVLADHPIVAQRTTYVQNPPGSALSGAATSSPGTSEAKNSWFVAEGATRDFDTWILVANPSADREAHVSLDFRSSEGEHARAELRVPSQGRLSVRADDFIPSSFDVFTEVASDIPVLVERAQYGTGGAFPGTAHTSEATSMQDTAWMLPEGATAGPFRYFVLVANPNSQATQVHLHFHTSGGELHGPNVQVPPMSRITFTVDDLVPDDYEVMTRVESSLPVVVDHSLYTTGSFTGDGTSSPGTPLFGQKRFLP